MPFINKILLPKKLLPLLIAAGIVIAAAFFLFNQFYFKNQNLTTDEAVLADPLPEPIKQIDCLAGNFRYEAKRGENVEFAVLSAEPVSVPELTPLPRGISGQIVSGEDGQANVRLMIGEETAPADYSLAISYGQDQGGAERLCQFNLAIK